MKLYGALENAELEVLSSDPSATTQGRIYYNSTTSKIMLDNGTNKRAVLSNDGKAVFGNSTTASNNVRFHRAGATVLQFVPGDDTTAEGTLATALGQVSARLENYTFSGKPTAGNAGRLAYISDRNSLYFDNGTVWSQVGSGSGGVKNYLGTVNGTNLNGDFELQSTQGWSLFNTTLTSLVPTGTITAGAASITTFAAQSTTKLAGTQSLQVASTGAITAGHGFISDAFTLDSEDAAARVLKFSFQYQVGAGASNLNFSATSANTFHIYLYDVANSTWVQPTGVYAMNQNAGVGCCQGTFQTASNATSYRFAVIAANASAGAATIYFDDFTVSPVGAAADGRVVAAQLSSGSSQAIGSSTTVQITGWGAALDTVGGYGSNAYTIQVSGRYRLRLNVVFQAAAVAGASGYVQTIINKNGTAIANSLTPAGGTASQGRDGTTDAIVDLKAGDVLTWNVYQDTGSTLTLQNAVGQFASVERLAGPTSGDEGRSVAVILTGSTTVINNTAGGVGIVPTTITKDTHSGFSGSTYTVPVSGFYQLNASFFGPTATYTANQQIILSYKQNGNLNVIAFARASASTIAYSVVGTTLVYANAGDTLQFTGYSDASGALQSFYGSIYRVSGPSAVTAQESVNCRASNNQGFTLTANANTIFGYNLKDYDSHNAFNTTTFTAPTSGKYHVQVYAALLATTLSTSQQFGLFVYKNGSFYCDLGIIFGNGASNQYRVGGNSTISLLAGDYIQIYYFCNVAGTLINSGAYNYVCVDKVGN